MSYYKKIVGDRIYLSPMCVEDADKYVEWFCDFKTADGIRKSGSIMTVEAEKNWIAKTLESCDLQFAIVDLETNKLIGNCGYPKISRQNRMAEVGIFIGDEENRSKGYGAEALKLLLDYGFNYLNLHSIMLAVMLFNDRAIACYKKVGFKETGRLRENYFLNGKYYDVVFMDILESEFEGEYIRNKNV